ncbi:hypothetical protein ColTof4_00084 [Colletotrichum tofieldiae]|nr:hypothetical protein ColTof4_00084 [Colletotrichum tofieldiae]
MSVLKGSYSVVSKELIWLAGDFTGQDNQVDNLWPNFKCKNGNKELNRKPSRNQKDYLCADFDLTKTSCE